MRYDISSCHFSATAIPVSQFDTRGKDGSTNEVVSAIKDVCIHADALSLRPHIPTLLFPRLGVVMAQLMDQNADRDIEALSIDSHVHGASSCRLA
jgi:hypothetical protein